MIKTAKVVTCLDSSFACVTLAGCGCWRRH